MKKGFTVLTLMLIFAGISVQAGEIGTAYRIHNDKGERVGTCKRDGNNVYCLYNMNGKKVKNPAEHMSQPANDCWLFDVDGIAIGKCTASRVILWGRR